MFLLQEGPNVKQMEEFFAGLGKAKTRTKKKHNDQQRHGEGRQNETVSMW